MTVVITAEHPASPQARALIGELDAHLEPLYARQSRHGFSVEKLINDGVAFFVIRDDGEPAGCGGIKLFGTDYGEIKRIRAARVPRPRPRHVDLDHLADFARSRHRRVRLETGIRHSAIRLYQQAGFLRIPPFGDYTDDPVSHATKNA
jgi:hypothetical protein